jgi:hypothetical protein
MTRDRLEHRRLDAQTRALELCSIARELWEDDYLNQGTMSELRCVLSALRYVHGAFSNAQAVDLIEKLVHQ